MPRTVHEILLEGVRRDMRALHNIVVQFEDNLTANELNEILDEMSTFCNVVLPQISQIVQRKYEEEGT